MVAFEGLSENQRRIQKLRGKGRLTEADVRRGGGGRAWLCWRPTSAIRWSRTLWPRSPSAASAATFWTASPPAQQIVKIVNEELVS